MEEDAQIYQKIPDRTLSYLALSLLLIVYVLLHFVGLNTQEFNGDEAAPLLLIDRMLDAFRLRDPRYFAYPFLFYSDPFRAFIPGILLHLFGPDRVLLRLPSIIEAIITVCVLFHFLSKQRVALGINILSVSAYAFSAVIVNNRTAGGDSFMRLTFLLAVYWLYSTKKEDIHTFIKALLAWMISFLTMLNAVVLVPIIMLTAFKTQLYKNSQVRRIIGVIGFCITAYLALWLFLPYQAYISGIQDHFINRGLFYYLIRAGKGVLTAPVDPFNALLRYTSVPFMLWLLWAGVYQQRVKEYVLLRWTHFMIWLFVLLLNQTTFHIVMFLPVLTIHAALMTHTFVRRHQRSAIFVGVLFVLIILANMLNMFQRYAAAFVQPTTCKTTHTQQLDESVRRIYNNHGTASLFQPCGNIVIQ